MKYLFKFFAWLVGYNEFIYMYHLGRLPYKIRLFAKICMAIGWKKQRCTTEYTNEYKDGCMIMKKTYYFIPGVE